MGKRQCSTHESAVPRPPDGTTESRAEYYSRMEEDFDETTLTQRIYAKESESLQIWVKRLWYQYCQFRGKDPIETLKLIPVKVLHNFFHWILQERSETLRTASTLQTYWNVFCLVRKNVTGCHLIEPVVKSQMHGVRQRLAEEFQLKTEKKPKPIMRAEDEFELLKTLWSSSEVPLDHERLRVQLALILQLAGITGNRPGALLGLRYENLKITLLRDPAGSEWPRLLIELTFKSTKGYLGLKDANTFGIPDVPSEPCLLLCPQVMLLSLLFADEAFAAPDITSPEQLFRLRVPPELNQQTVPIKDSLSGKPIFRRLESDVYGLQVAPTAAATDNWLRGRLANLGEVTGFDLPVGPYCFRRGNGEALDSSSLISDSQRNLILQHGSSAVFQHNYLSRYITQDTQAIYRGLDPQMAVMRAASGMTRSIDPRRPRHLGDSQLAEVKRHPEVRLLLRMRSSLAKRIRVEYGTISRAKGTEVYDKFQQVHRQHQSKQKTVRKALMTQIKASYAKRQPLADIERQLNGSSVRAEETTAFKSKAPLSAERARAFTTLFTFATSEPAEECERRIDAINAVTALSKHREPIVRKACRPRQTYSIGDSKVLGGETDLATEPKVDARTIPVECLPTQCIFCLGQANLSLKLQTKTFSNHDGLKRHFHRKHLRHYPDGQSIDCPHPECDEKLENKGHLQNHAAKVHKTFT